MRRLVGAGVAAFGIHGMAAGAETAAMTPPAISVSSESTATATPDLHFSESLSLVWEHKTDPRVIAFGIVTVAGLVTVIAPNAGRRTVRNGRTSTTHDGGSFFSFDIGGDGGCDGGDGGD